MKAWKWMLVIWGALIGASWAAPGDVELGGVLWQSDFSAAQRRARASGKPILLFDMVGRLDEKWC